MNKLEKIKAWLRGIDKYNFALESDVAYVAGEIAKLDDKWIPVAGGKRPPHNSSFIVWTKNDRMMAISSRDLNDWLISKYSITHFMVPEPPTK